MYPMDSGGQDTGHWLLARGGSLPGGTTTAIVFVFVAIGCLTAAYLIKRKQR
ncbi:hypothetical protein GCM10022232_21060 [Streptomyces plumbiresistens]|uniref:Gram-positive cocci surface proteins LPxTG domain-containing protein n=1 Tax=Streptomyces plumbiresistens TaxID=511811 RepID=A0ABP7QTL0_9ACTN